MIKYIATVKTWRDKINGNTYWSASVEDVENDRNLIFPFKYGSAYEIEAQQVIKRALNIKDKLGENSVIRFIRIENCSEEEVSEHGYYDENMLMHCSEGGSYYLQD